MRSSVASRGTQRAAMKRNSVTTAPSLQVKTARAVSMTRRDTQMAHSADAPLLGAAVGLGEGERASLCAEVPKPDGGGAPFPRLLFLVLLVLVAVWSSATRGGGDAARRGLRRAERVASRSRTPSHVDLGAAACRPLAVCAPATVV